MTVVRAARLVAHGEPLRVEDVELAEPGAGEVVVELAYAGVNPVDRYTAAGRVASDGPLPRTLGGEASGTLDGRPVMVVGGGLGASRDGVFATAVVAPHNCVYPLPDAVPLAEAACMGIVGLTAWRVVETAEVGPADRVLVLAAAGAVGLAAVSYAASKGAAVIGQTGSEAKVAAIRQLGASDAVVTDAEGLLDAVRDFAPTVVIDSLGGGFTPAALSALEPRGRLVLFGTSAGSAVQLELQPVYRKQLRLLSYAGLIATQAEREEGLAQALPALVDGRLRIRIGRELPLAQANDAFDLIRDRAVAGKVVLSLRP